MQKQSNEKKIAVQKFKFSFSEESGKQVIVTLSTLELTSS